MTETARSLLDELAAAETAVPDEELFIPRDYAPRIRAVGDVTFFVELLRTAEHIELYRRMLTLWFYWKDVPHEVWRQVLREVAHDPIVMYELTNLYGEFFAIDVRRMIESDPDVQALVKDPRSVSGGGSWWRMVTQDYGIDYRPIWDRLAAEGAPMRPDIHQL